MRQNRIRGAHAYRKPRYVNGRPAILAPNILQREFTVNEPNQTWVADITYIRTWQGWLYLAIVLDLFSRRIMGWSMQPTMTRSLVIDALKMAVRLRRPKYRVVVHSDQGSQYGSADWHRF
jgi:putative transposase